MLQVLYHVWREHTPLWNDMLAEVYVRMGAPTTGPPADLPHRILVQLHALCVVLSSASAHLGCMSPSPPMLDAAAGLPGSVCRFDGTAHVLPTEAAMTALQAALDASPSQQLAMIAAYNTMLAETRALFAAPPAGLVAKAALRERTEPELTTPLPEETSVRAAPSCTQIRFVLQQ